MTTSNEPITLARDVDAAVIPIGTKVTLQKGEQAQITQSLGGSYTVIVNGNMFRIEGKDADALGLRRPASLPAAARRSRASNSRRKSGTSSKAVTIPRSPSTSSISD
jgi:hypothetical protein